MISLNQVSLKFGDKKILNKVSFLINPNDRIGLIGNNGAGKSTLLKVILGNQNIDEGSIGIPKGLTFGYLPQQMKTIDNRSLYEEVKLAFSNIIILEGQLHKLNNELLEREDYESGGYLDMLNKINELNHRINLLGGFNIEQNIEKALFGLGFSNNDFAKHTNQFSGGWRMRIELAKILLEHPDVLLLDEPTNHLDIESIQWLEGFLSVYKGAVMLISHDRAFLNATTNRTIEIVLGKIYDYNLSYNKFIELRKEQKEQQLAAFKNQQKFIEETKDFIERFRYKATKAVQVQSRVKQLEKLEIIEVEEEDNSAIHLTFPTAPRSGSNVFELENIVKSYNNHLVLNKVDLIVERGDRIAFVGKNGEGKSTLIKIIVKDILFEGNYKEGHNLKIGYFAQNQDELLNEDLTVFETIDYIAVGDIRTKIRGILGAFLFRGEDIDKKVRVLSGGERSRLALIKLLLEPYNLLILDEPTNHLDMRSKDILKEALLKYDGTLIIVSHDREFLNGLVNKVYEFKNKKIKEFTGGIYDYLGKRPQIGEMAVDFKNKEAGNTRNISSNKVQYIERKEQDREIRKIENKIKESEKIIGHYELELNKLNQKLSHPEEPGNIFDANPLFNKYKETEILLQKEMDNWEKLNNSLDEWKEKRK